MREKKGAKAISWESVWRTVHSLLWGLNLVHAANKKGHMVQGNDNEMIDVRSEVKMRVRSRRKRVSFGFWVKFLKTIIADEFQP